jgi:adenylosuccinate synthase
VSNLCVIGLQWGDEAKGKLVDLMTDQFDIVVRYQGGANAGHTVVAGDQTYKLHLVPSGILNPRVLNVVAPGVVLHPETLLQEIRGLESRGVEVASHLKLSDRAHVVFPWHVEEDKLANMAEPGEESIGTTLRGIGPCYRDKVGRRHGLRLGDLIRDDFATRVQQICRFKNRFLSEFSDQPVTLDADRIADHYRSLGQQLQPMIADTNTLLLDAAEQEKSILFEGAQGALLDVDHGTYPFVTSSNSSGVGVPAGSGLPPRWIHKVIGVAKCYSTRVGGGPFPTEQDNEIGERIRQLGKEFGTTTGRPRRCGWFDAVAVRYTARLSGVDALSMMMLDVLSELEEIQVCTAYRIDGQKIDHFPSHFEDLRRAEPVYESLPGWQ